MSYAAADMIERNRLALLRLLAGLFVMAGVGADGGRIDKLPRHVRRVLLFMLRPIESSARRLVAARGHEVEVGNSDDTASPERSKTASRKKTSKSGRNAGFPMFDALPNTGTKPRRKRPVIEPRILSFDEPFTPQVVPEKSEPMPDDLIDSSRLRRRMAALQKALEDLDGRAKRFARELARRRSISPKRKRVTGLRPFPAGYRHGEDEEIDRILRECMTLERRSQKAPDTG